MNIIKVLGIAGVIAAASGVAGLAITNPGNMAETSEDAKDESLKTRRYQANFGNFTKETKTLIPMLTTYGQSWKLINGNGEGVKDENERHSATIIVEVPVVFFVDDLKINITEEVSKNTVVVNVSSNSRVGKSDLGENKRHVRQLLEALDEKFGHKNT